MRPLALGLLLLLAGCKLYNPQVTDCSVHCATDGTCPTDTLCKDGYCRLPGATNRCDCRPGEDRPCGGGKGECTPGLQRCGSEGAWGACLGEVKPVSERCDGKDNDCDGVVDNNPIDAPPCSKNLGVCSTGAQHCVAAHYVDCTTADYGASYQATETLCDNLDNDCDGIVDGTADRLLATGVVGDWELLAYPGGFALVSVHASTAHPGSQDIFVDRFDDALAPLGPSLLVGNDPNVVLAARNDGPDVFVVWASSFQLKARKVALDGSITPLTDQLGVDLATSDPSLQVGLSPTLLVATFKGGDGNSAHSVEWSRSGGPVVPRKLNASDAGLLTTSIYSVLASRGGRFVAYYAESVSTDGGSTESISRVLSTGGTTVVSAAYPGVSGSSLFESTFDSLVSVYDSESPGFAPYFPSYSGIYVQTNVLDGGSSYTVKESTDFTVWSDCHAAPAPNGAVMAYVNNEMSKVYVSSQTQIGLTTVIHTRPIDSDAGYGPPRIASNGTPFLGLGVNVLGQIFARRLCTP